MKPGNSKPPINEYYPELVRLLLNCGESEVPKVLVVGDDEIYDKSHFPDETSFRAVSLQTWFLLGMNLIDKVQEPLEPARYLTSLVTELAGTSHLCVLAGILNTCYALSLAEAKGMRNSGILAPLEILFSHLPNGAKMLMPVPIRFLKAPDSRNLRNRLLQNHRSIIIQHSHDQAGSQFGMGAIHESNRMVTLLIHKTPGPTTFFRIDDDRPGTVNSLGESLKELLDDATRKSRHGFTVKGPLVPHLPPLIEYYDENVRNPEGLPKLSDFGEVILGGKGADPTLKRGVMCVNSGCVTEELVIDMRRATVASGIGPTQRFKAGDICLQSRTDLDGNLQFVQIEEWHHNMGFDFSLLVIRLKLGQPETRRKVIQSYLRSPSAAKFLFSDGSSSDQEIDPLLLADIPIPTSIEVEVVFTEIDQARGDFENWAFDASVATDSLLLEEKTYGLRQQYLRIGKDLRLMHKVAKRSLELDYRIIKSYPRPLSFVWAEYKASLRENTQAPYESMAKVRKAAETLVAFLALVAASHLRYAGGDAFTGYRLSRKSGGKMGFDFGTWVAILENSISGFSKLRASDPTVPEWTSFKGDEDWKQALRQLMGIRNDDAHLRIPHADLVQLVIQAEVHLKTLFEKADFLTDYSLRIADVVKWDSYSEVNEVEYREIHGAIVYSVSSSEIVPGIQLESGSLYLVNRLGKPRWHLLRPFLLLRKCGTYKLESVFHLDSIDRSTEGNFLLKSFEFNTTETTSALNGVFDKTGLIGEA